MASAKDIETDVAVSRRGEEREERPREWRVSGKRISPAVPTKMTCNWTPQWPLPLLRSRVPDPVEFA